jgi:acetyl esterase/lipase
VSISFGTIGASLLPSLDLIRHLLMLQSPAFLRASCFAGLLLMSTNLPGTDDPRPLTIDEAQACADGVALPGVTAERFSNVAVQRDLEYARYGDQALLLDLYLPTDRKGPMPCVVVIVGGGFRAQGKDRFGPIAAYLATNGYTAPCISYRGTPEHTYLATIHDSKAAVRWVRANASRYGIHPDRIAAMGQSAGAHLATMLAVSGGVAELEGDGGHADQSSRIQAAVSLAGVFNFISRLKDGGQQPPGKLLETKRRTNGEWVGEQFSETSAAWRQASPITHLSADDAPVLLVHCRADGTVPFAQSEEMYAAMHPLSPATRLVIYDGGGHGVTRAKGINERMWDETLKFLGETLN